MQTRYCATARILQDLVAEEAASIRNSALAACNSTSSSQSSPLIPPATTIRGPLTPSLKPQRLPTSSNASTATTNSGTNSSTSNNTTAKSSIYPINLLDDFTLSPNMAHSDPILSQQQVLVAAKHLLNAIKVQLLNWGRFYFEVGLYTSHNPCIHTYVWYSSTCS